MNETLKSARRLLEEARNANVVTVATVDVGTTTGPLWRDAVGADAEVVFDLASLTKPVATATVVMQLIESGRLSLDQQVTRAFADWRGDDRAPVTVRDLLEHASGLPARLVDAPPEGRREFEHEICTTRLEYVPRAKSIYSDLGFILLGFLAADRSGEPL